MKYRFTNPSLFLKYAYPCIEFWCENEKLAKKLKRPWVSEFYKTISPKLLKNLKLIAQGKKEFTFQTAKKLEKLVPFAIYFLKKLGRKEGEVIIDEEVIRNYFLKLHERIIGSQYEKHKKIFELCRVKEGEIVKIEKDYGKVKILRNGERKVKLDFIKNPKVGDRVRIHFFYACEKL